MKQAFILLPALFILTSCSSLPRHFISLKTDSVVPLEHVLEEIGSERVLFVGEMHGDRQSHAVEFEVVRHLHEQGHNVVIAFEMFPSTEQDLLDQWVEGSIDERRFIARYHRIVNLPFQTYQKILRYARDNRIPVIGINAEKELVSNVSKNGIERAPSSLLEEIRFEKCSRDSDYSRMLGFSTGKQFHKNQMTYLCDGQRLRDAHMAYRIAGILKKRNVKVVAMVGVLHALKVAVPEMLQEHETVSYKVLMPAKIRHITETGYDAELADFLWY